MRYRIQHTTTYTGTEPVSVCHNEAWLKPRVLPTQSCDKFELKITPTPSVQSERIDYFGNAVHLFSFNQGYDSLAVTAASELEVRPPTPPTAAAPAWEIVRDRVTQDQSAAALEAYQYVFGSPRVRASADFIKYALKSFTNGRDILSASRELMQRIFEEFEFDARATTVTTPVEEVFQLRKGVCQDFAHLQIAMLRSLRLPARYVSGYLRTLPPPGKPRLIGADASHAWLSVYCGPELSWIDFDPTNNTIPTTDHITVAMGRDYSDVCPLQGVYIGGGKHALHVEVDVMPL